MTVIQRERGRDTGRGRSRLHAPMPDVGFDPGSPGSRPGPKAGAKPLRHPGIPRKESLNINFNFLIMNKIVLVFLYLNSIVYHILRTISFFL